MIDDGLVNKTTWIPISCMRGHQIYAVYFPPLDLYGFGCGFCHTLGTAVLDQGKLLEIVPVHQEHSAPEQRAQLLMGMHVDAAHVRCQKNHNLMLIGFPQLGQYGFGCLHCKAYALEFAGMKGDVLKVLAEKQMNISQDNLQPHLIHARA